MKNKKPSSGCLEDGSKIVCWMPQAAHISVEPSYASEARRELTEAEKAQARATLKMYGAPWGINWTWWDWHKPDVIAIALIVVFLIWNAFIKSRLK